VITFIEAISHPSTFTWSITVWLVLTGCSRTSPRPWQRAEQGASGHTSKDALGD